MTERRSCRPGCDPGQHHFETQMERLAREASYDEDVASILAVKLCRILV